MSSLYPSAEERLSRRPRSPSFAEKIVDYAMLKVTNYVDEPGYNRRLGEKRYEVCYEVK